MTPDEKSELFKALDAYSRTRHRCFLAELNSDKDSGCFTLCFRPTTALMGSADQWAHKYVKIGVTRADLIAQKKMLDSETQAELDHALEFLDPSSR